MPALLFAHEPERYPYRHSLAPGMPQRISWLPCIYDLAREAAEYGRGMGRALERFGHHGQGDGHGRGPVCRLDRDHADDLFSRVRAHDTGVPARCGLPGCHGKLGRARKVAAVPSHGHGDVVPVGRVCSCLAP
jgi:hypothetical protein